MVAVDLGHDLLPDLLVVVFKSCLACSTMEDSSKLFYANLAVPILVKHIESDAQVIFVQQTRTVYCSCDELTVVNLAITISVKLVDQVVPVLAPCPHHSKNLAHARLKLIHCQKAIVRCVQPQEHLLHVDEFG